MKFWKKGVFGMRRPVVLAVCLGIFWGFGWQADARGEEAPEAFYPWLNKYRNPQQVLESREQKSLDVPMALQEEKSGSHWAYGVISKVGSWLYSLWAGSQPKPQGTFAAGEKEEGSGVAFEEGSKDSGLGCFYHQDYYAHLPMFKGNHYLLPGSFEVSEVYYQKGLKDAAPAAQSRAQGP